MNTGNNIDGATNDISDSINPANANANANDETDALHLEALAINSGKGEHFLVIKNVESQYEEKQKTLQAARELLLSHHEIVGQHEYIRQRLDKTLLKNKRRLFRTLNWPHKKFLLLFRFNKM